MSAIPSGTVTFLFTDIEGSTRLWQERSGAMRGAHALHDDILRQSIESNHGYIFQVVGDSFAAAFHNALDALVAALAAQRRLQSETWVETGAIKVRMGLHAGAAEMRPDGKYDGYTTLATTQRVMSVAWGGQVLLSHSAYELCYQGLPEQVYLLDMGEHRLKDIRGPVRLYQLVAPDLAQAFPPIKSENATTNNLPVQLTSFIGRAQQLEEATRLLAATRLLTFIGPGGTGKTRLSLRLAAAQLPAFRDGAAFIELAPLVDPAYIASAIASALNLHEVQGVPVLTVVTDYLRGRQLLLLLDNCEHLVEACAQLADHLLHECPELKIVASSREALGISGETVYRVPSLKDDEATALFVERATQAEPRFALTPANAAFVAQICERLDGIPLAIELAAARVKLFSPQQIAERLDDRFKLLTGGSRTAFPRQQTLRALIDWSYQTLNEIEQRTMRRLAVFSGGWTIDAAEAVASDAGPDLIDGLAGLVNKSLVNVEEQAGASRYLFLETIRQYAMEKLVEAGEANETRTRHLAYFLKYATAPELVTFDSFVDWLGRMDAEQGNLRIALKWAADNAIEQAALLAVNIAGYWSVRDRISEAIGWYRTILQRSESIAGLDKERAQLYAQLGWAAILVGQHREGRTAAQTGIDLARRCGAYRTVSFASCTVALASVFLGDFDLAESAAEEAESTARAHGYDDALAVAVATHAQVIVYSSNDVARAKHYLDESIRLSAYVGQGWQWGIQIFGQARLAAILGDIETARLKFDESIEIARRAGNHRVVYANRSELAHLLRQHGLLDEAYAIYEEVLPGWKDLGHRAAVAHELECMAYILRRKEQPETAARLLSAAQSIRKAIDTPRTPIEDVEYAEELSTLQAMLGDADFQAHWLNGAALSLDEAIQLASEG